MATRAQQIELLATGVLYNGAVIATPYAKFLVAGTSTAKNAWDDADKSVAITKKALDAQGRAVVYGDGIYKIQIYSGDPDASGVLLFTVDNYKVTAVAGNTRTITAANVTGSVDDSLVEADTTSNNIAYTLPDAALMAGKIIQIAKSAAANTLTIAAASGQLVNGAASVAYTAQYSTGVFQSNGSSWYVFQTVGDAETLGGLASTDFQLVADMTTAATANKGVLRDANGNIYGKRTIGEKDSQTDYATAGLVSQSLTGDVFISAHASGSSAAVLKHVRGGNGFEVRDSSGALSRVKAANGVASDDLVTKSQLDGKMSTGTVVGAGTGVYANVGLVTCSSGVNTTVVTGGSFSYTAGKTLILFGEVTLQKGATAGNTDVFITVASGGASLTAQVNKAGQYVAVSGTVTIQVFAVFYATGSSSFTPKLSVTSAGSDATVQVGGGILTALPIIMPSTP